MTGPESDLKKTNLLILLTSKTGVEKESYVTLKQFNL